MILALAFASALTLPVRVDGEGYLRFVRDGRIVYRASATLTVQAGVLGSAGLPLTPAIRVPAGTVKLEVDLSGNVVAVAATKSVCGRLVLARFGSKPTPDRGFYVSVSRATLGNPGEDVFGVIRTSESNQAPTILAAAPPAGSGSASVAVRALTEALSDRVTLGDIAAIEGDDATKQALQNIQVGVLPSVGVDMVVTASRIQGLLKRAGLEAQIQVPIGAVVRRKAQEIKQEDFVAAATKAVQSQVGAAIGLVCPDRGVADFRAPIGQVELRPEAVVTSGLTTAVTIGVYVDGKRVNSRNVNLRPDASAQVTAGALVKVLMRSSGITVEVSGRTRTGGMVGQTVTVVTDTGSVLTGIVIGAGKVEVKL